MLFDDLSRRLHELRDEVTRIRQKNDEYVRDNSHGLATHTAFDKRRVRLEQIKTEIAVLLRSLAEK
ncbi:MAG: hypothetical protein QOD84_325 [Acidobacteriaceae bacterium]|jgi:hypothetical protein